MVVSILCESDSKKNFEQLDESRKLKYQNFYKDSTCCPERYILSVDVSSSNSKDQSCVIRYNFEEYLKGNLVIDKIKRF